MSDAPRFPSLTIVLPAYDEEYCIERACDEALGFLRAHVEDWELVVVDDGSSDRTGELVEAMAAEEPRLRPIRFPENRGYGRALAAGFDAAEKELVFFTDADSQFDVRELKQVIPVLEESGADVVLGFRVYRYDSVIRCFLSWTYNRIVRVLFGVCVRDVDCSFKLFRRHVLEAITIECDDFFVDTEIVARIGKQGFKTVEVGVRHYPREAGRTTVRASHIPKTLLTVFRMFFRIRLGMGSKG